MLIVFQGCYTALCNLWAWSGWCQSLHLSAAVLESEAELTVVSCQGSAVLSRYASMVSGLPSTA